MQNKPILPIYDFLMHMKGHEKLGKTLKNLLLELDYLNKVQVFIATKNYGY